MLAVFLLLNLVSWKMLILMQCLMSLWFSHNHLTPCHTLYHVWRQLRFRLASVFRHLACNNIWSHVVLKISAKSQFICKRINFSGLYLPYKYRKIWLTGEINLSITFLPHFPILNVTFIGKCTKSDERRSLSA